MAASKQELSEERTRKLEIDKEITRFFDERPEIIAVSLFGSRARGRAKETSDVDLVILNRAGETLLAHVFKDGRCLYNSSPTILSEFRTVEFSKIVDFACLKDIMEKGFTRRVVDGDQ